MFFQKLVVVPLFFLLSFVPVSLFAADWNLLPDTGQTKCYDVAGTEITCPAAGQPLHGQDAQYNGPAPSYLDHGNGTVTDNNTTLMWMQDTADTDNSGTITSDDKLTWQAAIEYCAASGFAAHSGWRLPSKFELESIVDYGRVNPAINPVYTAMPLRYCSATTHAFGTEYAWLVNFELGYNSAFSKTDAQYVRCVRSGV